MDWIWDLQGVGFRTIPGRVHNNERSVSSEYTGASASGQHRALSMQTEAQCFQNPLGHTTLAVKAEKKWGEASCMWLTAKKESIFREASKGRANVEYSGFQVVLFAA